MAYGDYIPCCKCGVKLLYDGDGGNRKWWEERFGSEPKIACPKCSEWQGLTDEEMEAVANSVDYNPLAMTVYEYRVAVQKATVAKLKEKNA
jgi:hypothetical protein